MKGMSPPPCLWGLYYSLLSCSDSMGVCSSVPASGEAGTEDAFCCCLFSALAALSAVLRRSLAFQAGDGCVGCRIDSDSDESSIFSESGVRRSTLLPNFVRSCLAGCLLVDAGFSDEANAPDMAGFPERAAEAENRRLRDDPTPDSVEVRDTDLDCEDGM